MRDRFAERVPSYQGGTLLWAWHEPFPDLRRPEHRAPGGGVRLKLEIDTARVVLSDFEAWHHILCQMYLPSSVSDYQGFQERWDARRVAVRGRASGLKPREYADIVDREFRGEIEASWPRCFDLPRMRELFLDHGYCGPVAAGRYYVQAVFEEIRREDVRRVTVYGPVRGSTGSTGPRP